MLKALKLIPPIFIIILVYIRWFSHKVFTSGDWWYYFSESMVDFLNPSVWVSSLSLGNIDITLWRMPVLNIPFGLFGAFGHSQEVAEKYIIFLPTILVGNVAVYLLAKKLFKHYMPQLISLLVFNYNNYYLGTTHLLLYTAGSFSVLSLFFFIKHLENRSFSYLILTAISFAFIGFYDLRVSYIMFFVFLLCFTWYIIQEQSTIKHLRQTANHYFLAILVFVLLNAFWVFPSLMSQTLVANEVMSRRTFGDGFTNIMYALTLYNPFWNGLKTTPFLTNTIPFYYWFVPSSIIISLIYLTNRQKRGVGLFFAIIMLIGIFLVKQNSAPYTLSFNFLRQYVPGFSAFREATKFFFLIAISYALLLGYLSENILDGFKRNALSSLIVKIALLFSLLAILSTTLPIINQKTTSIFIENDIPEDYKIIRSFINSQPSYFRTLWVPIVPRFGTYSALHPALGANNIPINWHKLVNSDFYDGKKVPLGPHSELNKNLSHFSFKYIIIPDDEKREDDAFYKNYIPKEKYLQIADSNSNLKKINVGTKKIFVYENSFYDQPIYLSSDIEGKDKLPYLESTQISQSEYELLLPNISKTVYLHFSESFHPQWTLFTKKESKPHTFNVINSTPININHSESVFGTNVFVLDPKEICQNGSCLNKDESKIHLTLFFYPQKFLYIGMAISTITFASLIMYLIIRLFKKHLPKQVIQE